MASHGPELVGRRFSSHHTHSVGQSSLSTFAEAIGSSSHQIPPTFLITFSIAAAEEFLPSLGFDWSRVVHGEQRFQHFRQITAGDALRVTSEIESYKSLAGNEFVTVRSDFEDISTTEKISSTWSTLVFRGAE